MKRLETLSFTIMNFVLKYILQEQYIQERNCHKTLGFNRLRVKIFLDFDSTKIRNERYLNYDLSIKNLISSNNFLQILNVISAEERISLFMIYHI